MENEKVYAEKQEIDLKLQNVDNQISSLQNRKRECELRKDNKGQLIAELKTKLIEVENTIDDLEKKKVFFKSQKEFIEKMNTQYQDIPDPIIEGRFITSTLPLDHHNGIIGKVKQVIPLSEERVLQFRNMFPGNDNVQLHEVLCETKFVELDPQQISNKIDEISQELGEKISYKDTYSLEINTARTDFSKIEAEVMRVETDISVFESQRNDILDESKKLLGEIELVDLELSEVKESLSSIRKKEE
jgi:chromosome segregation ATPase